MERKEKKRMRVKERGIFGGKTSAIWGVESDQSNVHAEESPGVQKGKKENNQYNQGKQEMRKNTRRKKS